MKHFNSLGALANHLMRVSAVQYRQQTANVLNSIGKAIQEQAQSDIGHLQPSIGQYPGWAPLAASTIEKKAALGQGLAGNPASPLYATGAFHDSIRYKVDKRGLVCIIGTNKEYIVYTELGTSSMPPRPVFGPAALKVLPKFAPIIQRTAVASIAGLSGLSASTFPRNSSSPGNIVI